jgi:hypothetical protein
LVGCSFDHNQVEQLVLGRAIALGDLVIDAVAVDGCFQPVAPFSRTSSL